MGMEINHLDEDYYQIKTYTKKQLEGIKNKLKHYTKNITNEILRNPDVTHNLVDFINIFQHLIFLLYDNFDHIFVKIVVVADSARDISDVQSYALVVVYLVVLNCRLRIHCH